MSRLSIELTTEQHQRVKATAALQGQSIKDYVLERVLTPSAQLDTQLEALLSLRMQQVKSGEIVSQSVESIFAQASDEID